MQDYIAFAKKNGVDLIDNGSCQFCGANTSRGIHECLEIFNLGFQSIDFTLPENHCYRFFIVDAHTLQHPEIHGRWSNHFHLTRLHLIFKYEVNWSYNLSPQLSDCLNRFKSKNPNHLLVPPKELQRGIITSSHIQAVDNNAEQCKIEIRKWAMEVYHSWNLYHTEVDPIAKEFLKVDVV